MTHADWVSTCTNIARTEALEGLVQVAAYLSFAVPGIMLARRGHSLLRFVPGLLALAGSSWLVQFPFIGASSVPLVLGWLNGAPPLWFRDGVSAVAIGLLVCGPALFTKAREHHEAWPASRIILTLVVDAVALFVVVRLSPDSAGILVSVALLVGASAGSLPEVVQSLAWVLLPSVVLVAQDLPAGTVHAAAFGMALLLIGTVAIGAGSRRWLLDARRHSSIADASG